MSTKKFHYTLEGAGEAIRNQLQAERPDVSIISMAVKELRERTLPNFIEGRPDMEVDAIATAQEAADILKGNRMRLESLGIVIDENMEVQASA